MKLMYSQVQLLGKTISIIKKREHISNLEQNLMAQM